MLFTLPAALLLAGCASPGPPQPPSLHLPELAKSLAAERVGGAVILTWTTSPNTTDGDALRGPVVAVVCRENPDAQQIAILAASANSKPTFPVTKPLSAKGKKTVQAQPPPSTSSSDPTLKLPVCNPIQRFAVLPGSSRAVEILTPALAAGTPTLIGYQVELFSGSSDHQHSAGPSATVYAVAGTPPPDVGAISLSAQANGVALHWQPRPGSATMEVRRTLITAAPGSAAETATQHKNSAGGPAAFRTKPAKLANSGTAEPVILETDRSRLETGRSGADQGGMIDPTALNGGTYQYVAQRVLRVQLAGRTLELRGQPSAATTVTYRDVFPPAVPTGLAAVPGGGFGQPPSIDLSWDLSTESDLSGYVVYRRASGTNASPNAPWQRLNASLVTAPAYRDLTVTPGNGYQYCITAVDKLGNESVRSASVQETVERP